MTTLAEAWAALIDFQYDRFFEYYDDPTMWSDPYVSAFGGNVALAIDFDDGSGDVVNYFTSVAEMAEGDIIPIRYFLSQPGSQCYRPLMRYSLVIGDEEVPWMTVENWILAFKLDIINDLTDALSVTETEHVKENSETGVRTLIHIQTIEAPDEWYSSSDGIRGAYLILEPWSTAFVDAPSPPGYASQPMVGDNSGLIEAINGITDQDMDISINQNAAAFSIRGRVVATGS